MRPVVRLVPATVAAAAVLFAADRGSRPAAPRINVGGIVNAASNRPAPDNFVSPGAIISIYGTGLANVTREVRHEDLVHGFLPVILSDVSVFFGPVAAPLFYISPTQINAQVPAELQPGVWIVKVRVNNLESSEPALVYPFSPGLFGVARHTDGMLVTREVPARPGEWIMFFGTGYGPTSPLMLSGALAPLEPLWMDYMIEARIGETLLPREDIYYWGLAPGYAGLYQFNLRIPVAAPAGDLEVQVKVADQWSQPGVRIAVAR